MTDAAFRLGVDATMLTSARAGVGNYVFNLLSELKRLPEPPDVFLYSPRAIAEDCRALGLYRECVGPRIRKSPLWRSVSLVPLLLRDRIDTFWGAAGFLPLLLPRGLRTVVTIYDLVERFAPDTMPAVNRWSHRVFKPLAARTASAVVAISASTGAEMKRYWGRAPDAVVHPRIDPLFGVTVTQEKLASVVAKYQLPARFFLTLGTLEPRKNLRALLDAYSAARNRARGVLPALLLAGNAGWLDGEIRAQVDRLTAEGSVRWLGYVPQEDLPALYRACEVFVFVPVYEGFGMPVREALLSGARVLASDIAALREAGGRAPTYVSPDANAIRDALLRESRNDPTPHAATSFDLQSEEIGSAASFMNVLAGTRIS